MKKIVLCTAISIMLIACNNNRERVVQKLEFPEKITSEQKIKLAAHLVPSQKQYNWQKLELTAFIHFGMNTFTDREWGDGTENPELFNPTDFDAEQWVSTLRNAGFKMLILTAKHHDGFCLWPTNTTQHSVEFSPWKEGRGDVVKEVKNACDKLGIKFGVYLSPWDRNAESYGDSPKYNVLFVEQLKELLTNYGEIHEVWFDGANGEGANGKRQIYDWGRFYRVIDSLQPQAVKAIMGDDIRWVGNEKGFGRETEWSVTPLYPEIDEQIKTEQERLGIQPTSEDLGSRKLIAEAKSLHWYPSEVDVSIRPGWFYHPEQDARVKSLKHLMDIYYKSVGMNSVLLLNVPPDTRGLIHEVDAQRLKEFGEYIKITFDTDFVKATNSSWSADSGDFEELDLKGGTINTVMLQEDILKGQRVEKFKVEGFIGDKWENLTEGTTIGYKRLLKFEDCTPTKLRITILETRDKANIEKVGAYYAPPIADDENRQLLSHTDKEKWRVKSRSPLIIDLGETISIKGFSYNPITNKEPISNYVFSFSNDGNSWEEKSKGEFSNIKNNPIAQFVRFKTPQNARYIRFETVFGANGGNPIASIEEIGILTE